MGKLEKLNSYLRMIGFELEHYSVNSNPLLRRIAIFKKYNISTLLDVGANIGIYGKEMRKLGFKGKIHSFEPLTDVYHKLKSISQKDANWIAYNYALGTEEAESFINISKNSHSSSILDILSTHTSAEPTASYIGKQKINITNLDSIFPNLFIKEEEIYLKIDTQGYELNVLEGAKESLKYINTIQLEMSLVSLYSDQMLFPEMLNYLWRKGYELISIELGFVNPQSGTLFQVDGIFRKKS